jgi:hypothetical protein
MKNLQQLTLTLLLTFVTAASAVSANADVDLSLTVRQYDNQHAALYIQNDIEKATLRVKDNNGQIIWTEKIRGNQYAKRYNFSLLPEGNYTLELTNNANTVVEYITVGETELNLPAVNPLVRNVENGIALLMTNTRKEKINVTLYDHFGNLLDERSFSSNEDVSVLYDLNNSRENKFNLVVNGETFTRNEQIVR